MTRFRSVQRSCWSTTEYGKRFKESETATTFFAFLLFIFYLWCVFRLNISCCLILLYAVSVNYCWRFIFAGDDTQTQIKKIISTFQNGALKGKCRWNLCSYRSLSWLPKMSRDIEKWTNKMQHNIYAPASSNRVSGIRMHSQFGNQKKEQKRSINRFCFFFSCVCGCVCALLLYWISLCGVHLESIGNWREKLLWPFV